MMKTLFGLKDDPKDPLIDGVERQISEELGAPQVGAGSNGGYASAIMVSPIRTDGPILEVKPNLDEIKATDDLVQRARNIVHALGFRGRVGDYILAAHEVLQRYDRADKADHADDVKPRY